MAQALTTRIALVTGSANGIGRAIALRLASDGFHVGINDIPRYKQELDGLAKDIQEKHHKKASIVVGDVSVEQDVAGMVQKTVQDLGGLDVMVANAGILISKPFIETSLDDWERNFSINARGVFLCYLHAAKHMIVQGRGGRIIGASSIAGKRAEPLCNAYSATKFAVRGITQGAALELGKYGITVNAYAPGAIESNLTRSFESQVEGGWEAIKAMVFISPAWQWYKKLIVNYPYQEANSIPAGRIGQPDDIANLVSFLASQQSSFITGQTISSNGGRLPG